MDPNQYVQDFKNALTYRGEHSQEDFEYFRMLAQDNERQLIEYFNGVMMLMGQRRLTANTEEAPASPGGVPDWYLEARSHIVRAFWPPNLGAIKERNRESLHNLGVDDAAYFRQCAHELLISHPGHDPYLSGLFEVYDPATHAFGQLTLRENIDISGNGKVIEVHLYRAGFGYNRDDMVTSLHSQEYDGLPLSPEKVTYN